MAKAAKALCWPGEFRILWKALDKDPVVFGALGLQMAMMASDKVGSLVLAVPTGQERPGFISGIGYARSRGPCRV